MFKKLLTILVFLLMLSIPAQPMELTTVIYNVTDTSATFEFMVALPIKAVNPKLYLEYGLDKTYGKSVILELSKERTGGLSVTAPAIITGLSPGVIYHYHLLIVDKANKINIKSMDDWFETSVNKKQIL